MKTMILMTSGVALLAALAGCGGGHPSRDTAATGTAGSTATADSLSGPPTFGEGFKARNPRKCTSVKDVPSPAQAAALIQCGMESGDAYSVSLWQMSASSWASRAPINTRRTRIIRASTRPRRSIRRE